MWNDVKRAMRTKQRTRPSQGCVLCLVRKVFPSGENLPFYVPWPLWWPGRLSPAMPTHVLPPLLSRSLDCGCGMEVWSRRKEKETRKKALPSPPILASSCAYKRTRPAGPPPSCGPDKQQNERLSNAFIYTLNTHTHAHKIACSHAMAGTQGKRCPSLFAPSFWVMMPFAGAASSLSFFPCL